MFVGRLRRQFKTSQEFVSGSYLMLFDEIQVAFTQFDGVARRPIAHTCNFVLKLLSTYKSFPKLRGEFNNTNSRQIKTDQF